MKKTIKTIAIVIIALTAWTAICVTQASSEYGSWDEYAEAMQEAYAKF